MTEVFFHLVLWQVNVLLGDGLINVRILFSNVSIVSEFLMFQSNLLHSIIAEGKKVFMRNLCVTFISGSLLHCFVLYNMLYIGMID